MSQISGPPGISDAIQPVPAITAFPYQDALIINGFTLPGKWTLTDAKRKFGWQIQKGFALSGATVLPMGDELIVATFKVEIWSQSDWSIYSQLRKQLFTKGVFALPGGLLTAALGIHHPALKALGVTNVVVAEVAAEQQEEGGLWTQVVSFLEYYPARKVPPKPKTVIPDIAPPTPTAQTAQQIEVQKLEAVAAGLQGA
jgi:hypothetical protein